MNPHTRTIRKVEFQVLSPPEGTGSVLEFLDENDDAFLEINIDADGNRNLLLYASKEHVSIPLEEIRRGIALAEKRVTRIDPDDLFDS